MKFPQSFVLFSLTAVLAVSITSCSENKVDQCNQIIRIANEAGTQAKTVTNGGRDPKSAIKAAEVIEKASQKMKDLPISDPKLKDYQSIFVKMYRDTSKATRDYAIAFEKKDRLAAEKANTNLQLAAVPEPKLISDMYTYCSKK